jgi:hypothetical protein
VLILAVRAHDALIVMITTWMSTVHSEMSDRTLPGGGFPSFNSLLPLNALCNGLMGELVLSLGEPERSVKFFLLIIFLGLVCSSSSDILYA